VSARPLTRPFTERTAWARNLAAPVRDYDRVAPKAGSEQAVEDPVERFKALSLLAIGHRNVDHARAGCFHRLAHASEIERRHDVIGDDGGSASERVEIGAVDEARANVYGVAALRERYAEAFHRSPSWSASVRASDCTVWRPVSTTTSATSR